MRAFGELEERIMEILWSYDGPVTVRQAHAELNEEAPLAYTTVMTVLDRLWRKKMVRRKMVGKAYEYAPVQSQAEYTASLMHDLLSRTRDRSNALAHFVRGMKKRDEEELRRLAATARKKRAL